MRAVRLLAALCGLLLVAAVEAMPTTVPLPDVPVTLGTPTQVESSAGIPLRVSLLTFAPGSVYWQRFGHNAVLIENTVSGANAVYNYGMFDFFQKNFFLNFARGHMLYRLDVDTLDRTLRVYASEGRWVYRQVLDLDAAQRLRIAEFLDRNAQPEHAEYRYDYFRDNCSTRVRDSIDATLGGVLKQQMQAEKTTVSYRFEATRLVAPIPALMAGMDLIMGPAGDPALNVWQQSFVPEVFMQALRRTQIGGKPLVLQEGYLLADARAPVAPARPLNLLPLTLPLGLLLGIAVVLLAARRQQTWARLAFGGIAVTFWLLCTLGGVVMLAVWLLTAHWVMWANHNLLLLTPLAAALLPAAFGSFRRQWQPKIWQQRWSLALAATALLTLPLALLPGAQQHWQWIALFLPLHLGLALGLRRAAR